MPEAQRKLLTVALDPGVFSRFPPFLWRSVFDVSSPRDMLVVVEAIRETFFDLIICSYPVPGMEFQAFLDEVRGFGRPCRSSPLLAVTETRYLHKATRYIGKGLNRVLSAGASDLEYERAAVDLLHIAPRVNARVEAQLRIEVKGRQRKLIARTENLSRSGMLVAVPGVLHVGDRLEFSVILPGTATPVRGTAKVVRVDRRRKCVGIQYLEIGEEEMAALGEYLRGRLELVPP